MPLSRTVSTPAWRIGVTATLALVAILATSSTVNAQPVPPDEKEMRRMAEDLEPLVAKLRGLDWKFAVNKGIRTRTQLKAMLMQQLDNEQAKAEVEQERLMWVKLGLIPANYDLMGATVKLYSSAIAGFYDPRIRELNIVLSATQTSEEAQANLVYKMMFGIIREQQTIAHELTHALDDQYFDLLNIVDDKKVSTDEMLAQKGLTEGTATSVEYDYLFHRRKIMSYENPQLESLLREPAGKDQVPGGADVPNMVCKRATFPYTVGNRLVLAARKRDRGSWETVNKMFEDLPASTEQILHPEKYLQTPRDYPTVFDLPNETDMARALGENWVEIKRDTFGEFQFWIYFEEMLNDRRTGPAAAKRAAAGWDGDRVITLQNKDTKQLALFWVTTWDSENDAIEFYNTYVVVLRKKYGDKMPKDVASTEYLEFSDSADTVVRMERRGKDVVIVESAPADRANNLAEIGFGAEKKAWTRPPRGQHLPNLSPEPAPKPIQSKNYDGKTYRDAVGGFALALPREGFVLTHERDGRIEFRAPEAERFERVEISWRAEAEAQFRGGGFAAFKTAIGRRYIDRREMIATETQWKGKNVWRYVFGGRDERLRERVVASLIIPWDDSRMLVITVSGYKDALNEIAADLLAIAESVKRDN